MSDDVPDVSASTGGAAPAGDNLDALLAEFDQAVPPTPRAEVRQPTDGEQLPESFYSDQVKKTDALAAAHRESQKYDELAKTVSSVEQRFSEREAKLLEAVRADQDRADFAKVIAYANDSIDDLKFLPADYAQNYLRNEAMTNAALAQAWQHRHDSPQAQAAFEHQVNRTLKTLGKVARERPDPIATADREAVADAMRRGRGPEPVERSIDWGKLTENEFNAEKARLGMMD